MSVDVLNEPCTVWFAVGGERVGLSFLVFLHSAGLVLLRFDDVSGCGEWAVPIGICCWWCEFWRWREIRFFCVPAVMAWVLGRWRELRPPPSMCNPEINEVIWGPYDSNWWRGTFPRPGLDHVVLLQRDCWHVEAKWQICGSFMKIWFNHVGRCLFDFVCVDCRCCSST